MTWPQWIIHKRIKLCKKLCLIVKCQLKNSVTLISHKGIGGDLVIWIFHLPYEWHGWNAFLMIWQLVNFFFQNSSFDIKFPLSLKWMYVLNIKVLNTHLLCCSTKLWNCEWYYLDKWCWLRKEVMTLAGSHNLPSPVSSSGKTNAAKVGCQYKTMCIAKEMVFTF